MRKRSVARIRTWIAASFAAVIVLALVPGAPMRPAPLHAQAFGIGGNIGYYTVNGSDFDNVKGGIGYEGLISLSPGGGGGGMPGMGGGLPGFGAGGFSLSAGIRVSKHDVTGSTDQLKFRQIFLGGGLNLTPPHSRVRPSVRVQGGIAHMELQTADATDTNPDANGFEVGGSIGAEIFMTHFLALEPSVFGSYLNFAEPTTAQSQTQPQLPISIPGFSSGQRLSGWMLGFRIGLNLIVG